MSSKNKSSNSMKSELYANKKTLFLAAMKVKLKFEKRVGMVAKRKEIARMYTAQNARGDK